MKKKTKMLGKMLVDKNIITQEDLQEALLSQKGSKIRLGQILVKKGLATEDDILGAISERYGVPYQKNLHFEDNDKLFTKIPLHFLKKNKIAPYKVAGKTIFVAMADVLNIQPLDDLKMLLPGILSRTSPYPGRGNYKELYRSITTPWVASPRAR